jgi:hypothetical protein
MIPALDIEHLILVIETIVGKPARTGLPFAYEKSWSLLTFSRV